MKKVNVCGYGLLDLFLIGTGVVTITVLSILFKSPWYVLVNALLALLCVFTQAKGKVSTQFIGAIYFCFYIFITYSQKLYGEAILYLTIMLPMYVYGIVHWLKNRNKKDNVVIVRSNLSKREWLFMSVALVVVSIGVYFLLKVLGTAELLISTLSFVSMLPAVYLLIRRCKWNQVVFLINDVIVPLLWLAMVLNGQIIFVTLVVYHFFQLTYDVYGFVNWIKLEKQQKSEQV
ncbi:MAG: nicotinamide mononucleotide transporter [Clostridia bacterium]|nr:nicotinamide mononucleotide transporter [Clostridia bacterium]